MGAALALGVAQAATAGERRLEINQVCAAVGCFSGDAPAFPVTIDSAGTYVLTGNLSVTDPAVDGITITPILGSENLVTIDLNGFEIRGPVNCSGVGSAVTCGAGDGVGIRGGGTSTRVVVVKNGPRVGGFGSGAIDLGDRSRIEGMVAELNGSKGISTGVSSIVSDCVARQNGGVGIRVGLTSIVQDSTAADNLSQGIVGAGAGVVVTRSTAFNNGHDGIAAFLGGLIRRNSAYMNELAGIAATQGSTVIDNASYDNDGAGIYALDGSTVSRNTVRNNGGTGLILGPGAAYRENTVSSNAGGTVSGGVNMGDNSCDGNTTCP